MNMKSKIVKLNNIIAKLTHRGKIAKLSKVTKLADKLTSNI